MCPTAEDIKSKIQMTHHLALGISIWFRLRDRQSTCQADQSITKNTVSALLCGTLQVGERSVNSLHTGGASGESAQLLQGATPQVLNHSPAAPTELLSIHQAPPHLRQAQQKAF